MRAFLAYCLLLQVAAAVAEPQQIPPNGARFVGAVSCKSSSCHGGAGEKRSQFITWSQKDFHTRSFAILTNARSARIAQTLAVSPTESSRCTSCHSPMQAVAPARLTNTVDPHESVSCENCHGAAEPWLRGHTRKDWSYATRVGAGMRDLKSIYVRANTCVACHQNLDSDIAAAGHPELLFELDSQSVAQPKHWRDEPGSGPRIWLTGQAVALRELSWRANTDAQTRAQAEALAWLLAEVTTAEPSLPRIDATENDFARVQEQADALARKVAQQNGDFAPGLLGHLAQLDAAFAAELPRELLWHRALRLVLALDRLGSSAAALTELREEVRDASNFDAARFANRLRNFRQASAR